MAQLDPQNHQPNRCCRVPAGCRFFLRSGRTEASAIRGQQDSRWAGCGSDDGLSFQSGEEYGKSGPAEAFGVSPRSLCNGFGLVLMYQGMLVDSLLEWKPRFFRQESTYRGPPGNSSVCCDGSMFGVCSLLRCEFYYLLLWVSFAGLGSGLCFNSRYSFQNMNVAFASIMRYLFFLSLQYV